MPMGTYAYSRSHCQRFSTDTALELIELIILITQPVLHHRRALALHSG